MEDDLKKTMQPKTIKSKNNSCGTAPGNLVVMFMFTTNESVSFQAQINSQIRGVVLHVL